MIEYAGTPVAVSCADHTPWGRAHTRVNIARGVVQYMTPSHGGIVLSPSRNEAMPEALRLDDGFYEEDDHIVFVVIGLPHLFTEQSLALSMDELKNRHPDRFEALTGQKLKPGESRARDLALFMEANKGRFMSVAAFPAGKPGLVRLVATVDGNREGLTAEREVLVPKDEYDNRDANYPFVIDEKYL